MGGKKMQQIGKMNRKRLSFPLWFFACLAAGACFLLCGCNVQQLSSLRAFAEPWQGAYICEYARFGGADILQNYRQIVLTLQEDGRFSVEARPKEGRVQRAEGGYGYDEASGLLTFSARYRGRTFRQNCALQGGSFTLTRRFCGLDFCAVFRLRA